ncbi:hypothetical protein TASIC1_0001014800 [Trichoderma asperellum]|uniref:Uncharacterized protein n=1 Tax=Trichoderma asperellum TaxID=101201 RepID=A0A6V8QJR2_TRIAP|nr:hypothetical protein TASIC1_0001014800 [Trichoderma asperellum]
MPDQSTKAAEPLMNMLGWYFCMDPLRSVIIVESISMFPPHLATGNTPAAGFAVSPERHSGTKSRPGC